MGKLKIQSSEICILGTNWNNGLRAGTFNFNVNNIPSNRNRNLRARLVYVKYFPFGKIAGFSLPCPLAKHRKTFRSEQAYKVNPVLVSRSGLNAQEIHTRMKRKGNLYPLIYDMNNLRRAHYNAQMDKQKYLEVRRVNENEEKYLTELQQMLINKTYHTSEYTTFIKRDQRKERLIYKLPYFPDRICQWAVLQIIGDYLIRHMITHTYSALKGRGIHRAVLDIKKEIREDPEGMKYCLKLDVKKYYPSIDHDILKEKYRRLFKDPDLLWLLDEIIDSTPGNVGIPIGNFLSQFSGNYYLSSFDHWIKEEKRIRHYFRYMDDIVILSDSKEYLHSLFHEVQDYMSDQLHLSIKDNWQVFPTFTRGLDFVGYRFFRDYTLLRKSTCITMKKRIGEIQRKVDSGKTMNYSDFCAIGSYMGWLDYCNSKRLKEKYIVPLIPEATNYYHTVILKKGEEHHD